MDIKAPQLLSENEKLNFLYNSMLVLHNRLDFLHQKVNDLLKVYHPNDYIFYNDTINDLTKEIDLLKEEFSTFDRDK